jgi:hypothetical protein
MPVEACGFSRTREPLENFSIFSRSGPVALCGRKISWNYFSDFEESLTVGAAVRPNC